MEGSISIKTGINGRIGLDTDITKTSKKTIGKPKRGRPKKLNLGNPVDGPRIKKKVPYKLSEIELPKSPLNKQVQGNKKEQTLPSSIKRSKVENNYKSALSARSIDIKLIPVQKQKNTKKDLKIYNLGDLEKKENSTHNKFTENAKYFADSRVKLLSQGQDFRKEYESSENALKSTHSSFIQAYVDKINYQIKSLQGQKILAEERKNELHDKVEKTEELIKMLSPIESASKLYANLESYEARIDKLSYKTENLKDQIEKMTSNMRNEFLKLICLSYEELENAIIFASTKNDPILAKISRLLKTLDSNIAIFAIDDATIERILEVKKIRVSNEAIDRVKAVLILATKRRLIESMTPIDIDNISSIIDSKENLAVVEYLSNTIQKNKKLQFSFGPTLDEITDNLLQMEGYIHQT